MPIACSHCQANLDIPSDLQGQVVRCPACNGKLKADAPAGELPATEGKAVRHGWKESGHANVNSLHAFLIGLVVSAVWLACCMYVPAIRFSIGGIFVDRGWAGFAETWLFFWGTAILYLKYLKIKYQERAALLDPFPPKIGGVVDSSTVGAFIDNIYGMPAQVRGSMAVNRIRKALEVFEARNSKIEAVAMLDSLSAVDANRSKGSYALVKVFLWAIPVLGFIGTMQGFGIMHSSLDFDPTDPSAIKAAFSNLTGGLSICFDPTLLGVVLSMFLSFLLALIRRRDGKALAMIDSICPEKLLPKLK